MYEDFAQINFGCLLSDIACSLRTLKKVSVSIWNFSITRKVDALTITECPYGSSGNEIGVVLLPCSKAFTLSLAYYDSTLCHMDNEVEHYSRPLAVMEAQSQWLMRYSPWTQRFQKLVNSSGRPPNKHNKCSVCLIKMQMHRLSLVVLHQHIAAQVWFKSYTVVPVAYPKIWEPWLWNDRMWQGGTQDWCFEHILPCDHLCLLFQA